MIVHENKSLELFNTFGITVTAAKLVVVTNESDLKKSLEVNDIPLLILGGGSNILFTKDFNGLVIKNEIKGIKIVEENEFYVNVKVGAGENWHSFVQKTIRSGFSGIENLSLIPDISVASVHPGWARSNFGRQTAFMRIAGTIMSPFIRSMTDTNEESAQTSLHCLISDDAPNHSGAYFSQSSVLYRDKECKQGDWPMKSPNPNATDLNTAKKLVAMSYDMVGL